VHAEFTGISPLGLYQIISVDGWIHKWIDSRAR